MSSLDAGQRRFPRSVRLHNAAQFRRVFRLATRFGDRAFTVLARANECGYPRLGLAISKRSVGRAVARNRIKRLVRESFRAAFSDLPAVDLVVMCRPAVADLAGSAISAMLAGQWRRVQRRYRNDRCTNS